MKTSSKLATLGAAVILGVAPGAAIAAGHGNGHSKPGKTPTTTTTSPGKAYGKFCQDQAKHHTPGGPKGTDFSRCVNDMAKLAHHKASGPKDACKDMSKKHTKGEKGTPFSRCVVGANRMLQEQHKAGK